MSKKEPNLPLPETAMEIFILHLYFSQPAAIYIDRRPGGVTGHLAGNRLDHLLPLELCEYFGWLYQEIN